MKIRLSLQLGLLNLELGIEPKAFTETELACSTVTLRRGFIFLWFNLKSIGMIDNNHLLCKKTGFMSCDNSMCLSALLSCLARRLRVATPLFPYDERPRGPNRVLSKSCLTSAEESGTDISSGNQRRFPARIWLDSAVSQTVLGRLNPSEEGNKCKFNIWGLFEVHLHLNECDRTWNDPC